MTIDGRHVLFSAGMTVYEAAQSVGIRIPVLCHREGLHPAGGCGVCVVEDAAAGGRLFPACATRAQESMAIETNSPAVREARRAVLELLLSNHPADCEAPCQQACPAGLPVPELMARVAAGDWTGASELARRYPFVCDASAPCEKACRRKPLGGAVAICALHRWLAGAATESVAAKSRQARFRSRMTGLSEEERLALAEEKGDRRLSPDAAEITREAAVYEARRCLQCGCLKPDACRLRELCAETGARQAAFPGAHAPAIRERARNGFRFDASRCVLCGICVRTAEALGASLAPAFHGRGFDARIGPPLGRTWDDVPEAVLTACAMACPTGAMALAPGSDR